MTGDTYNPSFVESVYREMYPQLFSQIGLVSPIPGLTLDEVRIRPVYSEVSPHEVDLRTKIGPITMSIPIFTAAMDTVSGVTMAKALSDMGGCCILEHSEDAEWQMERLREVLAYRPCMVADPKCVLPGDNLEKVQGILDQFGYSTIPVVEADGTLMGILFTRGVSFDGRLDEPVSNWMKPFSKLKTREIGTPFKDIYEYLLNKKKDEPCLPIIDKNQRLKGIYFMKDALNANPAEHNGRPLVGFAVGVQEGEVDLVKEAVKIGVGVIVIDSSHGNCPPVIEQAKRVVKAVDGRAAVIAGNITDIDGYYRLALAGVDAVKVVIGGGSICTTSMVTGAGFPSQTCIREMRYMRKQVLKQFGRAPKIIPDGGINTSGHMTVALASGGHAIMAGKMLVAATESESYVLFGAPDGIIRYWGMASPAAIEKRRQRSRYGMQKKAPEGVEGWVRCRGSLKKWLPNDLELVKGGFAHVGAKNIAELHQICDRPYVFCSFTSVGQEQNAPRVEQGGSRTSC